MSNPVLVLGLVCIVAAIVGGGLRAFGFDIPALQSRGRQAILAVFGVILVVAATYTPTPVHVAEPFDTTNNAHVQTKLTGFSGMWRGSGTDESSLFDKQQTSCETTIHSDLGHLRSNTVCNGQKGLHKVIDLSVTLDGDQFTGALTQSASVQGSDESVLTGSVSGHKTEDTAVFQVLFPGSLLPSATVNLKLNSPSSYSMHVTRLGLTVMEVVFNRIVQP